MADYEPIACALHERLEFSVLRKLNLELDYTDSTGRHRERVLPLDVVTRDRSEWLVFQKINGETVEIRLDAIVSFNEV